MDWKVLAALNRQSYDVVFMDVQMPEMDGLEASRRMGQLWPASQRPRIIAMTANALLGDRERCFEAGMDDYISKPVRLEEMVRALSQCRPLSDLAEGLTFSLALPGSAPEQAVSSTILDPAILEQLQENLGENNSEIIAKLIELYLEDAPHLLATAQQGLDQKKIELVEWAAHTLKASSATFGASRLVALCLELEHMGHAGIFESAAEKLAQIVAEYEQVKVAMMGLNQL